MISSIGRQAGRTKGCPTNNNTGGSMSFAGNTSSYLTVPNTADLRFGTGDFTIEFYMNITNSQPYPRAFSMGTFPSATIGVSIEGGNFYVWIGGTNNSYGTIVTYGSWAHYAISRSGTTLRVFKNGIQQVNPLNPNGTNDYNFTDSTNVLTIGGETSRQSNTSFTGLITNFHVVKGTALYTAKFCVPQTPRARVSNTVLLLNAETSATVAADSNVPSKTSSITNVGVTFSSSRPT
jgi:hypothetical protein